MEGARRAETPEERLSRLKSEVSAVPPVPGVYLWKNAQGEVIYVGKAKQLRARMRQYVNFDDSRAMIPLLVEQIDSFDYLVAENEHEALVLEKNLINRYSPYFNADFKDDKSYPFIAITADDPFPAVKYTREKHVEGTLYYGPFTDARAARTLLDVVRRVCPICTTSCADWRSLNRELHAGGDVDAAVSGRKPCFDSHVGLGPGACCGECTQSEYAMRVARVRQFLSGHYTSFMDELEDEMREAAANLDFERAARLKQRLETIRDLTTRQHVELTRAVNADVVGIFREETIAGVNVLIVRDGITVNSNEFILNKGTDVPDEDLIRAFLLRYYDTTMSIPREVVLRSLPEDTAALEEWLTARLESKHGALVHLVSPQRGARADLLSMAEVNAKHALMRYKVRSNYDDDRVNDALLQLESALALPCPPMRIECFDISTIHGSYTVASMVVFVGGKPDKSQYRRFKIRTPLDEANDFLSMQEVLERRYRPERLDDERFGARPDLVILDGGKPQLSAAVESFERLGITDISLVGLAKRDEEIFVTWQDGDPVVLPGGSASLYLVKQVRDESHRFAITFHRELRGKGMSASVLDSVAGIGPARKKALLSRFGSFKRLREASLADIKAAHVVPDDVAEELVRVLAAYNERSGRDTTGVGADDAGPGERPEDTVASDREAIAEQAGE